MIQLLFLGDQSQCWWNKTPKFISDFEEALSQSPFRKEAGGI
jgi:hypothetical protein